MLMLAGYVAVSVVVPFVGIVVPLHDSDPAVGPQVFVLAGVWVESVILTVYVILDGVSAAAYDEIACVASLQGSVLVTACWIAIPPSRSAFVSSIRWDKAIPTENIPVTTIINSGNMRANSMIECASSRFLTKLRMSRP